MMKIVRIRKSSVAHDLGLQPGDDIVTINGQPINDTIDFQFWVADDRLEMEVRRNNETFIIELDDGLQEWYGAEFEPIRYGCCGNKCVFCFIDQNPKGLRKSLYFKDEDYRLSFLFGNYVTLTNASQKHLHRIVSQKLSPLYISVHTTNPALRKKLLGLKRNDRLMEKIAFLAGHHIVMHAQIVLCPEWNDGRELDNTVNDLTDFFPAIKTVAIVPVGLTKHRHGLTQLKAVDVDKAREVIEWENARSEELRRALGTHFIYLADEFYLLTRTPIPPDERYEDYDQIENGVGMVRRFADDFKRDRLKFPKRIRGHKITIVTGEMAAPVLQRIVLPALTRVEGLKTNLVPVRNEYFGGGVTVSGLLVGQDIAAQLQGSDLGDSVFLPPNCLNADDLFLDNWTVPKLEQILGSKVYKTDMNFLTLFDMLKEK